MVAGKLGSGRFEAHVFTWTKQPTERQASIAGISSVAQTVIKFETSASFGADEGNERKSISYSSANYRRRKITNFNL